MVQFGIMFNVLEGGVIDPIDWSKDQFQPDRSIIVLDESQMSLYLWHGAKQGLVARRTALRQAESLKGHGYTIGKSIIGRDIKELKEIDARKVKRVPLDTELNDELQQVLEKKHKKLDNFIVNFDLSGGTSVTKPITASSTKKEPKPAAKPEPKINLKPEIMSQASPELIKKSLPKPVVHPGPIEEAKKTATPSISEDDSIKAKVSFVIISILDHYSDIWISKKDDGSYSVEMMDGPICSFSITEDRIKFSSNSFSGISTNIKNAIQKKFVDLNKLLK
ncbi:MAG: hypothetical protein JXA99_16875 [Candidatus Lokiarchaeota archaeon]|nr:hypothetical protein [Candidatus Lokiarchaeota archaeon]